MPINKPKRQQDTTALPLFDEYLLHLQVNNFSSETIYNYERDLKSFINFLSSESLKFEKLTKLYVDRFKAYLFSVDRSTSTVIK
jgi:site-specific recombinase XerD